MSDKILTVEYKSHRVLRCPYDDEELFLVRVEERIPAKAEYVGADPEEAMMTYACPVCGNRFYRNYVRPRRPLT